MSSTSSSPNTSDSSSDHPKDAIKRLLNIPNYRQETNAILSMSFIDSSPTSMQSMVLNNMNNIHPLMPIKAQAGLNMFGASGCLNNTISTQSTDLIGMDGDSFFGENEVLGSANINMVGAEGELFVPCLESISTTEESYRTDQSIYDKDTNNNYPSNINSNISSFNSNNNNKAEDQVGVENYFQEDQLTMGDWNLEDLMKDVSSFPFLDFQ